MADAAGSGTSGMLPHNQARLQDDPSGLGIPSRSDLLSSLIPYADLFKAIEESPEADFRERFLRARSIRAHYVGRLVKGRVRAWDDLQSEISGGKEDPKDEQCLTRFDNVMTALDDALQWYDKINEDDTKTANAYVVDQYYMDNVFRYHLELPGKGLRAPNGELRSVYGSIGDPVPQSFFALRGCDDDMIRRFILDKLTLPFNHRIYIPILQFCNQILRRDTELPPQGLGGRTLDILVSAVECAVAVSCFAASVTVLYNLETTKARLIATPFASFACTIPAIFFSRDARMMVALMAGIWAVLIVIVFLTNANLSPKNG